MTNYTEKTKSLYLKSDKNEGEKKISFDSLLLAFLTVAVPLICVGGASYFPYMIRLPLIYATGVVFVLTFIFSGAKLSLNYVTIPFTLVLIYIAISCAYSIDKETSFDLFLIYLCAYTLFFIDLPHNIVKKIISIMYVFCIVIALSIILSVFIDNCMNKYFWFIVNPVKNAQTETAINNELARGSYSGFAREMSEAAYIMNVGLAISFSKYFSNGKFTKPELFFTAVLAAALILTGKRTMFIIPIVCFALFIMISHIKSKVFKVMCITVIAAACIAVITMFIPQMANIFYRFLDEENIQSLGNRNSLWPYAYAMISKYFMFGAGFGSYNEYAYRHGLLVNGEKWEYNAHNSYIQIFGELGIVGLVLFLLFAAAALFFTFRLISKGKDNRSHLKIAFFSLYIQIMFLIYSVTGNPVYTKQMVFMWIFSIGLALRLKKPEKISQIRRNFRAARKHKIK